VHEQRPTTHERRLTGNQRSPLGLSVLSTYGQRYVSRGGALRKRFSDPDAFWGRLACATG
jgi:hypothetical protein